MGSKEEHGQIFSRSGAGRCYAFARRCLVFTCGIPPRYLCGAGSGSERVDARRQPRQLACNRVLVHYALGYRPMQLRLRQLKG